MPAHRNGPVSSNVRPQRNPPYMSTDTKPTPIAVHLQDVLTKGREMAARPNLVMGGSQMWTMRARAVLSRIYGDDAPQVDFWCPKSSADISSATPQQRIRNRLAHLEHLSAVLSVSTDRPKIFIGHGRSPEWLNLRIFLTQKLNLVCDEFNIEPNAGVQTASRIETMLAAARMAFLVMTAEDTHEDGSLHARENVIHEIGLFQAALGPKRAIVMIENGCSRFSNLDGLTTINFPPNDIMARSEQVRETLERELVIPRAGA